jgi:hypothetical protein
MLRKRFPQPFAHFVQQLIWSHITYLVIRLSRGDFAMPHDQLNAL